MAFGVAEFEMLDTVGVFRDCAGADVVREEVAAHLLDVGRGKGDFGEEVGGSGGCHLDQLDLLAVTDGKTGAGDAGAAGLAWVQPENPAVEFAGFVKVSRIDADASDASDRRTRGLDLRSERNARETCGHKENDVP